LRSFGGGEKERGSKKILTRRKRLILGLRKGENFNE